jgi:hypothetical protein
MPPSEALQEVTQEMHKQPPAADRFLRLTRHINERLLCLRATLP